MLSYINKTILFISLSILSVSLVSAQKQSFDLKASVVRGNDVYVAYCVSCHMDEGQGIENIYPPLAKADYLMADKNRAVRQVLYGMTGEIVVNGKKYNAEMTGFDLTDQEVSDVVNFIRNSWDNKGEAIRPEEVKALRSKE